MRIPGSLAAAALGLICSLGAACTQPAPAPPPPPPKPPASATATSPSATASAAVSPSSGSPFPGGEIGQPSPITTDVGIPTPAPNATVAADGGNVLRLYFEDNDMRPLHFTANANTDSWILIRNLSKKDRNFFIQGNSMTQQLKAPLPPGKQVNFQFKLPAGTYIISEPSMISNAAYVGSLVVSGPSPSPQ